MYTGSACLKSSPIAVEMLVAAYENLCDRIILVSSDTDLIPKKEDFLPFIKPQVKESTK